MKIRLLFLFFISICFTGFSQNMKISGVVYDSTGSVKLTDAIVIAVRIKDSLLLGYTRTNEQGKFDLKNIPIDTFNLIVSHFRFDDKSYFIFGSTENNEIEIPTIRLQSKAKEIQEVVIYANKNPIYFRGDTLVYVADSFKVGQNAVVEDLLKKLPGISVDQFGNVKSQGKEISKVFVDGDEFFGTDPTIATKNLGANGIKTVEIYEAKNETAVDGENEMIQIMNLKLKEDAKVGFFGRISAASDIIQYHEGEFLINKFNKDQKISVFLLSSNTPRSGFDRKDTDQFGINNDNAYKLNSDGDLISTGSRMDGSGIPKTLKTGIYFTDKIGKKNKTKIGFNYTFNNYQLNTLSQSYSQYFLTDTVYSSVDSTRSISTNESHALNLSFLTQLDSLNTLEIKPSINYSLGSTETDDYSHFFTSDNLASRSNIIVKGNDSKSFDFDNEIKLNHSFKKIKRELKYQHDTKIQNNNSEGTLESENLYLIGTSINDTVNQLKYTDNINHIETARLTYTEPLSKKIKLESEYMFEYTNNYQSKESRNILGVDQSEIDTNYTNKFETIRKQNRLSLTCVFEFKKHTISFGSRVRNIQIENLNVLTDTYRYQSGSAILPKFNYTFSLSKSKRIQFRYNTSSSLPSINALQPIPDNSNPNRIKIGNENLKPTFNHSAGIDFNSWNSLSNRYFLGGTNFNYSTNSFVDSTTFDSEGRQYTKTVNAEGNFSNSLFMQGGFAIYKKILEINPSLNASYNKSISYIEDAKNIKSNTNFTGKLGLKINLDSLYIGIQSEFAYINTYSSINSLTNNPYTIQKHSADFTWTLPWWHLSLRSDAAYIINGQRTDGYNIKYFIWNASLDKTFLKKENLIISFRANDMLNQNIVTQRSINTNVVTDYKTKIISRYFLLKIIFKFNNKKKEVKDE